MSVPDAGLSVKVCGFPVETSGERLRLSNCAKRKSVVFKAATASLIPWRKEWKASVKSDSISPQYRGDKYQRFETTTSKTKKKDIRNMNQQIHSRFMNQQIVSVCVALDPSLFITSKTYPKHQVAANFVAQEIKIHWRPWFFGSNKALNYVSAEILCYCIL